LLQPFPTIEVRKRDEVHHPLVSQAIQSALISGSGRLIVDDLLL
jgi:hypothetical protein